MNSFSLKQAVRSTTILASSLSALIGMSVALPESTQAQSVQFSKPYQDSAGNMFNQNSLTGKSNADDRVVARGRRTPPKGYKESPDNEITEGDDPDHIVQRDSATGANLDNFGTAYQESNPMQTGSLGDATGNGWTAPRGNGW